MALQWLHGALSREEFGRFLDQVFHFVATRTRRHASTKECDHHIEFLFVTKVRDRIAQLKSLPEYGALKPLIERACGDLDALVRRYIEIFQRTRSRLPHDHLVIGHGDLCFSNILYAKTTQLTKQSSTAILITISRS
jgi:thiamine kinase-like enzyme